MDTPHKPLGYGIEPSRTARVLALTALAGLLVAACTGLGGESTSEDVTSTTSQDTTTTSVQTTTTTSTPTTTSRPPADTNDLASGSGCKPGTEETLPDGEWYGYIVDLNESEVEFDLACWFSGDAAVMAASEDGAESPPPNDYYIRNENETLRVLAVGSSAEVEYLANGGDPNTVALATYQDWYLEWEVSDFVPGYWLTVEGGEITRIAQQYFP